MRSCTLNHYKSSESGYLWYSLGILTVNKVKPRSGVKHLYVTEPRWIKTRESNYYVGVEKEVLRSPQTLNSRHATTTFD
jgi:hypothetical protein